MLDPRIYRTGLIAVVLAVIVVAFSLENQSPALQTNLVPDAYSAQDAWALLGTMARSYPRRGPGSADDRKLAGYIASQLRQDSFTVSTDSFAAPTPAGRRRVENVVGMRAGLGSGTIVLEANRDSLAAPGAAALSGTAVMLELARLLSGQTQQHTVVLASTSGLFGSAAAARLAARLPKPIDAVIALGDLAGTATHQPVVVPWADDELVAPPLLRNTVAAALQRQAGLAVRGAGLGGQIAHLAFPLAPSEQAPFEAHGDPAVLISLSGDRLPAASEAVSESQIGSLGRAVAQAFTALDNGAPVPGPSSYMVWAGKVIPAWAIRLLVLGLLLPALVATVDGVARVRRRGQAVLRGCAWALSAALPFVLAAAVVLLAGAAGLSAAAPAAPVPGRVLSIGGWDLVLLAGIVLVLAGGLLWLRPLATRSVGLVQEADAKRASGAQPSHVSAGNGAGVLLVLCVLSLALWYANPYAAAVMAPALHMWMWSIESGRLPLWARIALLLGGLVAPAMIVAYYAVTLGLNPVELAWSWILLLAGGAVGWVAALEWSVFAGCALSVAAILLRSTGAPRPEPVPVTVRGPLSYAGPGSLGGTESALRR
jgi:hypothetical protein